MKLNETDSQNTNQFIYKINNFYLEWQNKKRHFNDVNSMKHFNSKKQKWARDSIYSKNKSLWSLWRVCAKSMTTDFDALFMTKIKFVQLRTLGSCPNELLVTISFWIDKHTVVLTRTVKTIPFSEYLGNLWREWWDK